MLTKLGKEKGCEVINEWIRSCVNHVYWSATTTMDGNGDVILAKYKAFLSHILNKHKNLPDPLFSSCSHGPDLTKRKWLLKG